MSHTEGTALQFESEWLLYPTSVPHLAPSSIQPPPTRPPHIDSIRDITGTEKTTVVREKFNGGNFHVKKFSVKIFSSS